MATLPKLPRLKSVRLAKMLSQEELAEKAGVSRVAITRLEKGDIDARFATVRRLAAALGVAPGELTAEDGPRLQLSDRCANCGDDRGSHRGGDGPCLGPARPRGQIAIGCRVDCQGFVEGSDAGRELDALVAEKVMGNQQPPIPRYSDDTDASLLVVKRLEAARFEFAYSEWELGGGHRVRIFRDGKQVADINAATRPLAICQAALAAVEAK